jgi:hypothetical protein
MGHGAPDQTDAELGAEEHGHAPAAGQEDAQQVEHHRSGIPASTARFQSMVMKLPLKPLVPPTHPGAISPVALEPIPAR